MRSEKLTRYSKNSARADAKPIREMNAGEFEMCGCASRLDETLKPMNYRLTRNLLEEDPPVLIEMHKIEKRKRSKSHSLVAAYCPFCGSEYPNRSKGGVVRGDIGAMR